MHPKDAAGIANSVDPDQTALRSSLIWVCTVCPDRYVRKLRIIMVNTALKTANLRLCFSYMFAWFDDVNFSKLIDIDYMMCTLPAFL